MNVVAAQRFSKMHGAGNHFVVVDLRGGFEPAPEWIRAVADPCTGVGFDQLLGIEAARTPGAVAGFRIWNTDGSPARQCGNGARCVASWLRREGLQIGRDFVLDSPSGPLRVEVLDDGRFAVEMGRPDFAPTAIPFTAEAEAPQYRRRLFDEVLSFGAVSMGNPHAVVEVADAAATPVATLATRLQGSGDFPDGVNVGFAQVLAPDRIRLRVYERGVGETRACGSGACAAVAVLVRRGRVGREVAVELPGGVLGVRWPQDDAPVTLSGPTAFVFDGSFAAAFAAAAAPAR
ncbi:diaminopimelate epimerase [Arenimonas composti]|uniref:Diaminopimelate epimerase n=1 Tax=Arenimonas composti TR7-09 = DSM 18010 TaxID=1121013 RepID=A0A091BE63_9GAMM|nr:diaminopimelate epimerase [Arenimonas composti]KFN49827.1 hypothetical protein P873_08885 [Arenimonas composti TR7-09 = DSM 18010]